MGGRWVVKREEEGEVEGREGGREGGRAREGGTRARCVELQGSDAAAAAAAAALDAAARGMRTEKKVRRVRAERASEPLLHPFDCPSLALHEHVLFIIRVIIDTFKIYSSHMHRQSGKFEWYHTF